MRITLEGNHLQATLYVNDVAIGIIDFMMEKGPIDANRNYQMILRSRRTAMDVIVELAEEGGNVVDTFIPYLSPGNGHKTNHERRR